MVDLVVPVSVRDLTNEDLPACAWSGTATHLAHVARELDRAQRGEVDYLAVCPPSDLPVAIGMIDYQAQPDAGTLSQLAVQGLRRLRPQAGGVGRGSPGRFGGPLPDHVHADAQEAVVAQAPVAVRGAGRLLVGRR